MFTWSISYTHCNIIIDRCAWVNWRSNDWTTAREISMCVRRILQKPVSQSANEIWKTSLTAAFLKNGLFVSNWATFLCQTSWEDSYWDFDPRYATIWKHISMAFIYNSRGGGSSVSGGCYVTNAFSAFYRTAARSCSSISSTTFNLTSLLNAKDVTKTEGSILC